MEEKLRAKTSSYAGAIYIENSATGVVSTSNHFKNCFAASRGGAISVVKTSLQDTSSSFYNNQALIGGSLYSDSSTVTFTNSVFNDNFAVDGGAVVLDNYINANFD